MSSISPSASETNLPRVALVTGGARGIGAAIAGALANDGHKVVVADLNDDQAKATASHLDATAVHLDVTDSSSVDAAVAEVEQQLGAPEILVNNAGWDELRPFLETDEEFWDRVIDINYKGALRVTRRVVPNMLEHGWGRIVNIGSDAARVGSTNEAVYAGAKGAVISFTKTLARELAKQQITANAVCPGPTRTPMLEEMAAEHEEMIESLKRAVPMRRLAEPHDIAAAVAFLASEQAGFITGQTLSVSGGLTMA